MSPRQHETNGQEESTLVSSITGPVNTKLKKPVDAEENVLPPNEAVKSISFANKKKEREKKSKKKLIVMPGGCGLVVPTGYGPKSTFTPICAPAACESTACGPADFGDSFVITNDADKTNISRISLDSICTIEALERYFGMTIDTRCFEAIEKSCSDSVDELMASLSLCCIGEFQWPAKGLITDGKDGTKSDPEGTCGHNLVPDDATVLTGKVSALITLLNDKETPVKEKKVQQEVLFNEIVEFISSAKNSPIFAKMKLNDTESDLDAKKLSFNTTQDEDDGESAGDNRNTNGKGKSDDSSNGGSTTTSGLANVTEEGRTTKKGPEVKRNAEPAPSSGWLLTMMGLGKEKNDVETSLAKFDSDSGLVLDASYATACTDRTENDSKLNKANHTSYATGGTGITDNASHSSKEDISEKNDVEPSYATFDSGLVNDTSYATECTERTEGASKIDQANHHSYATGGTGATDNTSQLFKGDFSLITLENELIDQDEKIKTLTASLERHRKNEKNSGMENELKVTTEKLNTCIAERDALQLELEKVKGMLSVIGEKQEKAEDSLVKGNPEGRDGLPISLEDYQGSRNKSISLNDRSDQVEVEHHHGQGQQVPQSLEEEIAHGRSRMDKSASQVLSEHARLASIEARLSSFATRKGTMVDAQSTQMHSQQKELGLVEGNQPQFVTSGGLDNIEMLKELESTKEALLKSEEKHAEVEKQLEALISQQKKMDFFKDQFISNVSDKALLLKELKSTKEALSSLKVKNDVAEMQIAQMLTKQNPAASMRETKILKTKSVEVVANKSPQESTKAPILPPKASPAGGTSTEKFSTPSRLVVQTPQTSTLRTLRSKFPASVPKTAPPSIRGSTNATSALAITPTSKFTAAVQKTEPPPSRSSTNATSELLETPPTTGLTKSKKLALYKKRYGRQLPGKSLRESPNTVAAKPKMTKKTQETPQETKQDVASEPKMANNAQETPQQTKQDAAGTIMRRRGRRYPLKSVNLLAETEK
eukprot:CAMPEP_0183715922 /NCGR_PEP_ID=MMETSP0737-20130205/9984_1 /TAXON_ID=385413 /ORGANISM="Thalassiosira miniscula, Strain CCMP1093" /LENGTH=999 /DNA_ID=CAMNT_0025945099 /DNA_START=372 /DNA_END=3371 /DNA_ORIENTATION=+